MKIQIYVSKDGSLHRLTFEVPAGFIGISVYPENIGEVLVSAKYPDGKSVWAKLISDEGDITFAAEN